MAGHSQFANIMYRKGAQDKKRAKLFAKLAREITVAAKEGLPDPDKNPRLRAAMIEARKNNMPKDRIKRAMSPADTDGANFMEMRYEGYGPGNVAVIVEALTDNRNRTASELRTAFTKSGGTLGETNSVAFNFERVGYIRYGAELSHEQVFEAALEAGAEDVESGEAGHDVYCAPDDLNTVREALEGALGEADAARLDWKPNVTVELDQEQAENLLKFLDVLDDNDDVQRVSANYEISDDVMALLSA